MNFIYTLIGTPLGYVMWACYSLIPNYCVALTLFVLIARALQLPLSIKQQKNLAKQRVLQPRLQQLQQKYGKNREKYQEETMKFYQEEGFNPAGGCLPMIVTFLVLFGIIDVVYKPLKHIVHLSGGVITQLFERAGIAETMSNQIQLLTNIQGNPAGFSDLIAPEKMEIIQKFSFKLGSLDLGIAPSAAEHKWPIILIPILAGVIGLVSGIISMRSTASQTEGQAGMGAMKGMMYVMPIISIMIAWGLPAAIGLYWIISSLFGLGQQLVLGRIYNPEKLAEQYEAERAAKKAEQKGKRTVVRTVEEKEDGEKPKVVEETVSEKEYRRRKIAEARRRMAEKYGDVYDEEDGD